MRPAFLLVLSVLGASAQDGPPGRGPNFYSIEKESALGASLAAEVRRQSTPVNSVTVSDYVTRIGARLSSQLPGAPFPYTFTVVAGDVNNATHEPIALPGGQIFVPADLFLAAKDEAEFAGMLAHSMVHVSERHYTREATRVALANEATVPLSFMGGWTGYGTRQGGPVLVPVGMLKFQQVAETEADTLAVAISSGAGFDLSALLRYINRVQAESPGTGGRAFAARVSNLEAAIQAQPQQTYTVADPDEFGRIQVEVRQVTPVGPRPLLKPVSDQAPTLKRQN